MDKIKSKIFIISILDYYGKKKLLIFILKTKISTFIIKKVNIIIISANIYYAICK